MQCGLEIGKEGTGRVEVRMNGKIIGAIHGTTSLSAVPAGRDRGEPVSSVREGAERLAEIYIEGLEAKLTSAREALVYFRQHPGGTAGAVISTLIISLGTFGGTWVLSQILQLILCA